MTLFMGYNLRRKLVSLLRQPRCQCRPGSYLSYFLQVREIRDMMVASSHVLSLIPGGTYPMGIYLWADCCFCKNK
jgi:hypothetical protein